jgi:hypothetical protein
MTFFASVDTVINENRIYNAAEILMIKTTEISSQQEV